MKPVRVLEVFGKMNRGGAETMMMNLYRKMDRSRIQLDFMVHTEEHCQYDEEIEQLGGRIFRVPQFKVHNLFSYIKAWRSFFKTHPEISVVHGHIGSTAAIYLLEANRFGCFTIAHSHSAFRIKLKLYHITYYLLSFPTRFIAQHFFGCSTEAGIARYGHRVVNGNNYQNFPNGIDLNAFKFNAEQRECVREKLNIKPEQLVIMHVGRIVSAKNPAMIYKVFKEIIKQDQNTICIWVGFGELEKTYQSLVREEGLNERIIMTGARTDIPELLQAADAFLFPSLWEGLPVSVIEAQASGLPCIIADTISKEVEVSDLIEWHSLSEQPELWARRCIHLAKKKQGHRMSPLERIRNAGYDINGTSRQLMEFYLKNSK